MNLAKLLTSDFLPGKILVTGKAIFDILVMVFRRPSRRSLKLARLLLLVKPAYTMVTNRNLVNLSDLVLEVDRVGLQGDIVECGVWNGGSAAVMAATHMEGSEGVLSRDFWLFDSFEGLPEPGQKDPALARDSFFVGWNLGSESKVRKVFKKVGVALEKIHIIPGWFEETLSSASVEQIAILHVDADWYDSVRLVLEAFYDRLVVGGYVILDDYGFWKGCDQALNDFLSENEIEGIVLRKIGRTGAYFKKPESPSENR